MNEKEAIEILEGLAVPIHAEAAYDMAVEALKKQIPMHPVQSKEPRSGMGYDYYDWVCPTCGCFLAFEPAKTGPHHCICGQAIDWSENNDSAGSD